MKYLSVLFIGAALAWTWSIANTVSDVSTETHAGIQSAMAQLVRSTVLQKRPQARDFLIQKMKTEDRENGTVRVHFQYAFTEPDSTGQDVRTKISGIAFLERGQAATDSAKETWAIKKFQTTSDVLTFENGLLITPGPGDPNDASAVGTEESTDSPKPDGTPQDPQSTKE